MGSIDEAGCKVKGDFLVNQRQFSRIILDSQRILDTQKGENTKYRARGGKPGENLLAQQSQMILSARYSLLCRLPVRTALILSAAVMSHGSFCHI